SDLVGGPVVGRPLGEAGSSNRLVQAGTVGQVDLQITDQHAGCLPALGKLLGPGVGDHREAVGPPDVQHRAAGGLGALCTGRVAVDGRDPPGAVAGDHLPLLRVVLVGPVGRDLAGDEGDVEVGRVSPVRVAVDEPDGAGARVALGPDHGGRIVDAEVDGHEEGPTLLVGVVPLGDVLPVGVDQPTDAPVVRDVKLLGHHGRVDQPGLLGLVPGPVLVWVAGPVVAEDVDLTR